MPKTAPRAGVRRALNQKQLVLFYQPIHELDSRKIMAAEALLRARRGSGEIRNAEYPREPGFDQLPGCLVRKRNADTPGEGFDLGHAEISEDLPQVSNQPGFEKRAVPSLEGQLVVMDDGAAHGLRRLRLRLRLRRFAPHSTLT